MTDYHSKPLLSCRVPPESLDWARGEAKRRGESFGDFIDGLITAERHRGVCPDCKEWVSPAATRTNGGNQ